MDNNMQYRKMIVAGGLSLVVAALADESAVKP
jgi:hypothetical protein